MKNHEFFIFLSIVFIIYSVVNYYIYIRGYQALPNIFSIKLIYNVLFVITFLAYIIGMILIRINPTQFASLFVWIGSIWLGAMLYFFIIVLLLDEIRLVNHFFHFIPIIFKQDYKIIKLYTFVVSIILVASLLLFAYINAANPQTKEISIKINKIVENTKKLKMVVVSDIHIGVIISNGRVKTLVDRINATNPDIVVFAGDVLDEDITPVLVNKSGDYLQNIHSKYGVYSVLGNHEYIGGVKRAIEYLSSLNINLLIDSTVLIDNSFYLIGRNDRNSKGFMNINRQEIKTLIKECDKTKPLILLDHQPINLNEAMLNKIDLQLSGHTHHGQLFPLNLITQLVYEKSWGYFKKGDTQYYVSSGYGTWGPPFRLGNSPELLIFNLEFK